MSTLTQRLMAATAVFAGLSAVFFLGVAVYRLLFTDDGALEAAAASIACGATAQVWFLKLKLHRLIYAIALVVERSEKP